MQFELKLVVLLPLGLRWVLNDGLFSVDSVLLQLMAQHSLDRLALVVLSNLLNSVRDRVRLKIYIYINKNLFSVLNVQYMK